MNNFNLLDSCSFNTQFDAALLGWEKQQVFPYSQALASKISASENIKPQANNAVAELKQKRKIAELDKQKKPKQEKVKSSAYKLYQNAYEGSLPFMVIGGKELRDASELLLNFGALAEERPLCVRQALPEKQKGSILCDSNWNIVKNDAYILGSIHAKKTFYIYSKTQKDLDQILWDKKENRPHIAGREIAILYAAGYRQVAKDEERQKYGVTLVCLDREKAEEFTLKELVEVTAKKTSVAALNKMLAYHAEN